MVVAARIVKEAPDWVPQCGVGVGGISSASDLVSFSKDPAVMMAMVSVFSIEINDALDPGLIICICAKIFSNHKWLVSRFSLCAGPYLSFSFQESKPFNNLHRRTSTKDILPTSCTITFFFIKRIQYGRRMFLRAAFA